jgi:protein-disulfide isomerase
MKAMIDRLGSGWRLAIAAVVCAAGGLWLGWYWQSQRSFTDAAASLGAGERAAIEKVVRDYVLENPEILPEAMENLRRRETLKLLAGVRDKVETPFPGAVLGNPAGKVTLVEFSDFACGYCRKSVGEVESLIAANPDLKVVLRQLPILSPASADAARMSLAAAEQGKYAAFHRAMFAAGNPGQATIEAAARVAGLDLDRARRTIADPRIDAEIERNMQFARQLGFQGTPSWVIGEEIHSGAVGVEQLSRSIAKARG